MPPENKIDYSFKVKITTLDLNTGEKLSNSTVTVSIAGNTFLKQCFTETNGSCTIYGLDKDSYIFKGDCAGYNSNSERRNIDRDQSINLYLPEKRMISEIKEQLQLYYDNEKSFTPLEKSQLTTLIERLKKYYEPYYDASEFELFRKYDMGQLNLKKK